MKKLLSILTIVLLSGCQNGVTIDKHTLDAITSECKTNEGVLMVKLTNNINEINPEFRYYEVTCNNGFHRRVLSENIK